MGRDDRLPKGIDQATESMGLALHEAGLLTPGEARQWIEETKEDLADVEAKSSSEST